MDADEIAELRPAPVGVRVVPLELRRTDAPLKIEGRVAASRAVAIKAPSSGVVGALDVQLGSPLKAGDLICTIGADAHEQRVLAAEAQRLLLEAQLEERRDALVMARARPEPPERVASFEAKMRAAEHRVAQERVNQRRHELASALVEVRAPFDARVAAVSTAPGASLVAGHALIELVEIDPAVVVLEVPTWVAARCRPGARVAVRADSDLDGLPGHLHVGYSADGMSVEIDLDLTISAAPDDSWAFCGYEDTGGTTTDGTTGGTDGTTTDGTTGGTTGP